MYVFIVCNNFKVFNNKISNNISCRFSDPIKLDAVEKAAIEFSEISLEQRNSAIDSNKIHEADLGTILCDISLNCIHLLVY